MTSGVIEAVGLGCTHDGCIIMTELQLVLILMLVPARGAELTGLLLSHSFNLQVLKESGVVVPSLHKQLILLAESVRRQQQSATTSPLNFSVFVTVTVRTKVLLVHSSSLLLLLLNQQQ